MLKYVNNLGAEPNIKISAKYLSSSGNVSKNVSSGTYTIDSNGAVLIQLSISNFNGSNFSTVKTKLALQVKKVYDQSLFKLFQIDSAAYSKDKRSDITLYSAMDTILYKGKSAQYANLSDVIEFDLTKYMYNYLKGKTTITLYFALTINSGSFEVFDISDLADTDVVVDMQLNCIKGLDSIYEYDQEEVGFAGITNINLANGKMIHKIDAIQTDSDEHPAVFHMFFNSQRKSRTGILGDYWTFSGEYNIEIDTAKGTLELTDSSDKTLFLQCCTAENIKKIYDMEAIEPFAGTYYLCLSEAVYCIVKKDDGNTIIFVDKNNNKMYFETSFHNLTKIELSTGKSITFAYSDNKVSKITDGAGQYLSVSYTNNKVSKVEHFNKNGVKLGYILISISNNRIDSIKTFIGNETVCINEAAFTYDSFNRLRLVSDKTGGISSNFEYSNQSEVVRVEHIFNGDPDKQKYTTYDYSTFQTIVTDYTGFSTNYYFDYYGRCKNIIDCEAKSITRNYDEVIDNNPGNLSGESKLQINERNIIDNSSFDSSDELFDNGTSWALKSGLQSDIKIIDGGVYGQKCLRITKSSGTNIELVQTLRNVDPGYYTFKAFFKAVTNYGNGVLGNGIIARINVAYREKVVTTTSTTDKYHKTNIVSTTNYYDRSKNYELSNQLSGTFDWVAYEKTGVAIPGGSTISDVVVTLNIILTGSGYTAFIDDLSLSYGDHIVRYNFVNNGYFENLLNGWELDNSQTGDGVIMHSENDGHPKVLGDKVLRITGNAATIKKLSRRININGGAGEELLLTMFGKANVSVNELFSAFIQIHYIDTNKVVLQEFAFDTNFENWQVLTRKIVAERAFDYVVVGLKVRSSNNVLIDAIQLYKDSFGKEYSYTEKKNMTQMVSSGGECAEISYDSDSNITEATDESGDTYRYTYDNNKKVTQITNNQNTRVLFDYKDGRKISTKLISSNGEKLITKESYDSLGQLTSQTDDCGNKTAFEYDSIGRKISETDAKGMRTTYKYNALNQLSEQLSELGADKSKCVYTYDSRGNISTIKSENGTLYSFTYTNNQQVNEVFVDGKLFVANYYTHSINGVNTNLLTKQILGNSEKNGFYSFSYDMKQRLTNVKFNNIDQVKYLYDEKNQVTEIFDCVNGVHQYLSYDSEGNVVAATNSDGTTFAYDFDNLNNLQKITQSIDGVLRSFDYEYKCEYNDYTPSGYFARLQRAFPDEIIKGGSGFNGIYGAKATLKTVRNETINVSDDSPLGDTVPSLSFKKDNAVISYEMKEFNTKRKAESAMSKAFDYTSWKYNFRNRKSVYGWIKPSGEIIGEQRIFALASTPVTGIRFKLAAKIDGTITVSDALTGKVLTSSGKMIKDVWNLVGLKVEYNVYAKTKSLTLVLNNEILHMTYSDDVSLDSLKQFILGAPSPSLSISDVYKLSKKGSLGNSVSYPINMAFRVAFVSIGSSDISDKDFKGIYEEGNVFLKGTPNYGASGVTYFNEKVFESFDVISLNGSLSSIKRMKPKSYSFTEDSFKIEKSRMFRFDTTGVNPLNRHVYASFDSLVNLNKGNPSKLAYDLLLKDSGTITIKFKIDSFESSDQVRTILYAEKNGVQMMKLFVAGENVIFQTADDAEYYKVGEAEEGVWSFVSIRYSGNDYKIQVDGEESEFSDCYISLEDAWTYIGCSIDSLKTPIDHLNGCLEMLAFKDRYATDAEISNIEHNGNSVSVRTYYDELGRTSVKKIHSRNKTLSKQLTYQYKSGNTTTRIQKEQDYSGNTIEYGYDATGQINSVITRGTDNSVIDNKQYNYDGLSRLISSTVNNTSHSYSYDSNNNLNSKDGINYIYDSVIKDRLISRSDGTLITYNDSFIGNPTSIIMPGRSLKLSWLGRRLSAVNNISYNYNQDGIRVGKVISDGYLEKYFLEGDRISVLKRIQGEDVEKLSFVYDEAQMLVGFSYKNQEYFYDRSVIGEINSILDRAGHVLVRYSYDDWGKPLEIVTDGTDLGNKLKELNPFIYKGYFYDKEVGLYYLKTRYYDPELGRFISADSEVGSVGNTMGMNLFAYCKCNPINYVDENGNWLSWAAKICIGLAVIAVCAIVAVATAGTGAACLGMSMLVGAAKGAAIGAVQGAISGAVMGAVTEGIKTGSWEGALKGAISGAVNGAADGFMFGAIGGAVSGAMNPKFCFVAGTLVMTKQGYKAIEEIKKGDQVLSFNSNLGIYDYKDVVDVYVNETSELCHIKTESDEIVCTPNHSILTEKGWMLARDIKTGDNIKTKDGVTTVVSTQIETLSEKIKVYNFNVLGYHTYVVGNELVVVHNSCKKSDLEFDSMDDAMKYADDIVGPNSKIVNKNGTEFHVSADGKRTWRLDIHNHGNAKYQKPHINLERWQNSFFDGGRNKLLENIHLLW